MKQILSYLFLLSFPMLMIAQNSAKLSFGEQFIETQVKEKYDLTTDDLNGMIVTDNYTSKHNGVTHIYFQQTFKGIPIQNANMNLNITKDNAVPFYRSTFYKDVKSLVNSERASLNPEEAIIASSRSLDLPVSKANQMIEEISKISFKYENSALSSKTIPVNLKYQEGKDGSLKLVWDVELDVPGNTDYWSLLIDAKSGDLLKKTNYTIYCNVNHTAKRTSKSKSCNGVHAKNDILMRKADSASNMVSGSYKAYILPTESPNHGAQSVTVQPHNLTASPFGWHDTNGADGNEFTTTQGNNVHAFLDLNGDGFSDGNDPDGGVDLVFDFDHDVDVNADQNYDAAVVNLFYSINAMHDLLYEFGFDESSGNYQFNNYGNGGLENDHMLAGEANPAAADNASFLPTPDGLSGQMNMGVWTSGAGVVFVNEPTQLQGTIDAIAPAGAADGTWGIIWSLDPVDVSGDVALATDGSIQAPTQCCNDIINGDEINGKIAIIDRGLCDFGTKGLNAQEAGAIGVIICNVEGVDGGNGEELVNMNGGTDGLQVTIPVVFAAKSFCDRVKLSIASDVNVNIQLTNQQTNVGPENFNSSFDNGVIAHELGHGVNGRLVGGPNNPGGLSNAEQMGEGWSDFFGIAFTIEETDTADDPRGVGTYVIEQAPDGTGIRLYPYSRDMSISPYTYGDIIGANEVHAIGEIWTAMLWDVMWNFIDIYGFDPDWKDVNSGNYRAFLLVMDGFKLVGANPGFEDSRDAIIAADDINYQGEHLCMLWETFARRGLGFNADQGSPNDSNDGIEGFEMPPVCQSNLKITKTVSEFIDPGDDIDVTIFVGNYTADDSENTIVLDNVPSGLTYVGGSGSMTPTENGNELSFDLGTMDPLAEETITYKLSSDPANASETLVIDDIEEIGNNWTVDFLSAEGFNLWSTSQLAANSPSTSWYVEAVIDDSRQTLIYNDLEVKGANPALRFWHSMNTTSTIEGGFVEITADGGLTWERVDEKYIRNGYPRTLAYTTFAIPALNAFSGNTGGFIDSYIDLSEYIGQTINVKYRFATQEQDVTPLPANSPGWFVDDFELMDLLKYESSACIDADNQDMQCTDAATTIVDSEGIDAAYEVDVEGFEFNMFPNPASDNVNISLQTETRGDYIISISTIDGRKMYTQNISVNQNKEFFNINLKGMNSGFYIVQLETRNGTITRKLIVE